MKNQINHDQKRTELVAFLRSKGIADENVLRAFEKVPRHLFFTQGLLLFSPDSPYENKAFPIGEGQTISSTSTAAFQSELLQIKPNDKVLEIGTGSGYLAALFYEMGAVVHTIEINFNLYKNAKTLLQSIGYEKVSCYRKDGYTGLSEEAPFDKILVTVCVTDLPRELLKQLKVGGLLVLPFGTTTDCQLVRITKHAEHQYSEQTWSGFAFSNILRDLEKDLPGVITKLQKIQDES